MRLLRAPPATYQPLALSYTCLGVTKWGAPERDLPANSEIVPGVTHEKRDQSTQKKTLKSHLLDHPGQVKNCNISGSFTNFLARQEGISYLKRQVIPPPHWRLGSV